MKWNWQRKSWPKFDYTETVFFDLEKQFLTYAGIAIANWDIQEDHLLTIEILSQEALKTSEIEGEILRRDSVQSSIQNHFGFVKKTKNHVTDKEKGISLLMTYLYKSFNEPLTHNMLWDWNQLILSGKKNNKLVNRYRNNDSKMQVVSGPIYEPNLHFEAPPAQNVMQEMDRFIHWFNQKQKIGALQKACIIHLYFVSIHPFEDGNGRIARALAEKVLAQEVGQPSMILLSKTIHKYRKVYYQKLEDNNKYLEINEWIQFFSKIILEAQSESLALLKWIVKKNKVFLLHKETLNKRQKKVLQKFFDKGPVGFDGGLSAANYIAITNASRATVTRDLDELVHLNILSKTGVLKHTRYFLSESFS